MFGGDTVSKYQYIKLFSDNNIIQNAEIVFDDKKIIVTDKKAIVEHFRQFAEQLGVTIDELKGDTSRIIIENIDKKDIIISNSDNKNHDDENKVEDKKNDAEKKVENKKNNNVKEPSKNGNVKSKKGLKVAALVVATATLVSLGSCSLKRNNPYSGQNLNLTQNPTVEYNLHNNDNDVYDFNINDANSAIKCMECISDYIHDKDLTGTACYYDFAKSFGVGADRQVVEYFNDFYNSLVTTAYNDKTQNGIKNVLESFYISYVDFVFNNHDYCVLGADNRGYLVKFSDLSSEAQNALLDMGSIITTIDYDVKSVSGDYNRENIIKSINENIQQLKGTVRK